MESLLCALGGCLHCSTVQSACQAHKAQRLLLINSPINKAAVKLIALIKKIVFARKNLKITAFIFSTEEADVFSHV